MDHNIELEIQNLEHDRREVQQLKENAGENLKKLREEIGVNQDTFSKVMGVSRAALSYYENGSRTPDIDFVNMVSIKTQCSTDYLLGWSSTMNDEYLHFRYALDLDEQEAQRLMNLCDFQSFKKLFDSDEFEEVLLLLKYGAHEVITRHVDQQLIIWKCMKIIEKLISEMLSAEIDDLLKIPEIKAISEKNKKEHEELRERLQEQIHSSTPIIHNHSEEPFITHKCENPFELFRRRMAAASAKVDSKRSHEED